MNLNRELLTLSQQRATGELVFSFGDSHWHLYLLFGRLIYATGGAHSVRRWQRAVTQHCPDFRFEVGRAVEYQPWECYLLKLGVEQNQLRLTQAKRIISMSVHEVLFTLFSQSDLSSFWFPKKQHPIALLEIQEVLPPAQKLWQQWQEMGLERVQPDRVPVRKFGAQSEEFGDEIDSSLLTPDSGLFGELLDGTCTIWDIALQVKQPVTTVAHTLMNLADRGVLELQTVPDFPLPVKLTASKMLAPSVSYSEPSVAREVLVTDELAYQLQSCVSDRFTGRLDIEDAPSQQWSFYFQLGSLIGCTSLLHSLRRWCRQLFLYCPQLQNTTGDRESIPLCWDYAALAALVRRGEVLKEQMVAVVEGYITEVLFDIYQHSERLLHRSSLQLTYKRVPDDIIDIAEVALVSTRAPLQLQQQAMRAWEAWQRAGLADYCPNLAPLILQPEELRRQTSPHIYQNLTALALGNLTLRDLAVKLQQHLLPLTQSLVPYLHQGSMGLAEVDDFSCVVPLVRTFEPVSPESTVSAESGVQFHIHLLDRGETMSTVTRPELGDFSSIVCFKAVITGMEDALGEKATAIALISAGRARGKRLADSLGLTGAAVDLETTAQKMGEALGKNGTRLCKIEKIYQTENSILVYTSETVCSAGEQEGSARKCTFTLGAVWGALEQVLGKRLQGKHTESVLRGGNYDVFEFTVLD